MSDPSSGSIPSATAAAAHGELRQRKVLSQSSSSHPSQKHNQHHPSPQQQQQQPHSTSTTHTNDPHVNAHAAAPSLDVPPASQSLDATPSTTTASTVAPSSAAPSSSSLESSTAASASASASVSQRPIRRAPLRPADEDNGTFEFFMFFLMLLLIIGSVFVYLFSDLFQRHSRGAGFGNQFHSSSSMQMQNTEFRLMVNLDSIYLGSTVSSPFPYGGKQIQCSACAGTGGFEGKHEHVHTCTRCGGTGVLQTKRSVGPGFYQMFTGPCSDCQGTGMVIKKKCNQCHGSGIIRDTSAILSIPVPPGCPEGFKIVLKGQGDQASKREQDKGVRNGDVIIQILSKTHEHFRREGEHLHYTHYLTLKEALLGFSTSITLLDGSVLPINRRDILTYPDEILRIEGRGMPAFDAVQAQLNNEAEFNSNTIVQWVRDQFNSFSHSIYTLIYEEHARLGSISRGDLWIHFKISFPKQHRFTSQEKEDIRKLLP